MAGITAEGTLWIELADVFAWLTSKNVSMDERCSLKFSVENDALQVIHEGGRIVEIDAADLWSWVTDKHVPQGLDHCEIVFGVPAVEGPDLKITFAAGSETNPRSWRIAPACLAEWNTGEDITQLILAEAAKIAESNKRIEFLREKRGPLLSPLTEDEKTDCLMTADDFTAGDDAGNFSCDDGNGVWATATHKSELTTIGPRPDWATHVVWYNR